MRTHLATPDTTPAVLIGRVSTRRNARQHYDVGGRAYCGAGTGAIHASTQWQADGTVALATVCRRCLRALRAALDAAAAAGSVHARDAAYVLAPPAVAAARDADLLDALAADLTAAAAAHDATLTVSPDPFYRERLLTELRSDAPGELLLV